MPPVRRISRRTILRGVGACLALPWLEAMGTARTESTLPRRLAFVYVPNGVHMADWTPAATGADYQLTPILAPLAPVRQEVLPTHRPGRPPG